jgi:hypothetical protein
VKFFLNLSYFLTFELILVEELNNLPLSTNILDLAFSEFSHLHKPKDDKISNHNEIIDSWSKLSGDEKLSYLPENYSSHDEKTISKPSIFKSVLDSDGFIQFCIENMNDIRNSNPSISYGELHKIFVSLWSSLSEFQQQVFSYL